MAHRQLQAGRVLRQELTGQIFEGLQILGTFWFTDKSFVLVLALGFAQELQELLHALHLDAEVDKGIAALMVGEKAIYREDVLFGFTKDGVVVWIGVREELLDGRNDHFVQIILPHARDVADEGDNLGQVRIDVSHGNGHVLEEVQVSTNVLLSLLSESQEILA